MSLNPDSVVRTYAIVAEAEAGLGGARSASM